MTRCADSDLAAMVDLAHGHVLAALTEIGHSDDTTEASSHAARAMCRALASLTALQGELEPESESEVTP